MVVFLFPWLFLCLLAYLLLKFALKKPDRTPQHHRSGLLIGFSIVVFFLLLGLWCLGRWAGGDIWDAGAISQAQELTPEGSWSKLSAKVADSSEVNHDKGYVAYVEFDSAVVSHRSFKWYHAEGVVVELEDGTKVSLSGLRYNRPANNWNWPEESNYRFLKKGDGVIVIGHLSKLPETDKETGATYNMSSVEQLYFGSSDAYLESSLHNWSVAESWGYLVMSVLYALSALVTLAGLIRQRNLPPETPGSD